MPSRKRELRIDFVERGGYGYRDTIKLYAQIQAECTSWCGGWVPFPEVLVWLWPDPDVRRWTAMSYQHMASTEHPFKLCAGCGVFAEPLSRAEIELLRRKTVEHLKELGFLEMRHYTHILVNRGVVPDVIAEVKD